MKKIKILLSFALLLCISESTAQDYGCDKCSMLQEEYQAAVSPEKEKIYAFFKQECLKTDTVFVSETGEIKKPAEATAYQVTSKGKCIDYNEVKEFEKNTKKVIRSFSIIKKDTVYTFATIPAAFPGGDVELVKFLSNAIQYPVESRAKKIEGTVYLSFVVNRDGNITGIKMLRSPDKNLTSEAIRVIKSMPVWEPAKFNKEAVSMQYILPVKFRL